MPETVFRMVTINGGSSSIKFAAFELADQPRRMFTGLIERIGSSDPSFVVHDTQGGVIEQHKIQATNHQKAAEHLTNWLVARMDANEITAVGHRVVHGGTQLVDHQQITDDVMAELGRAQPLDLAHLPLEIALIEVFRRRFKGIPQFACFDTVFHRDLPDRAKRLPIPREFERQGVRRLGFHGLSYSYLMTQLQRIAGHEVQGRVILAHLGSGASMVAVREGKPVDTSMTFTPTAGLMMGTRPGDMDPGLLIYIMRIKKMTPEQADMFVNTKCGLLGVSETSADVRDLLARRSTDLQAAQAIELFCYQAKKYIGAYSATLGGLDTLVFSGGVGEHAVQVRSDICEGLDFLGVDLDAHRNDISAAIISPDGSPVTVRVIPTDEEIMMVKIMIRLLNHATER